MTIPPLDPLDRLLARRAARTAGEGSVPPDTTTSPDAAPTDPLARLVARRQARTEMRGASPSAKLAQSMGPPLPGLGGLEAAADALAAPAAPLTNPAPIVADRTGVGRPRSTQVTAVTQDILKPASGPLPRGTDRLNENIPRAPRSPARAVGDVGLAFLEGVQQIPGAAAGAADIVLGGVVGETLEKAGYNPARTTEQLRSLSSPQRQLAQQRFAEAEGVGGKIKALADNPLLAVETAASSAPLMAAGATVAGALPAALSAPARAAIGEGLTAAGAQAEDTRQQSPTGRLTAKQRALAVGTGITTGAFGALGGKVAQRFGFADPDLMFAAAQRDPVVAKSVARAIAEGAVAEGLLEEAPQSLFEQWSSNLANNRPINEGVADNVVLGAVAGGLMGGLANVRVPRGTATEAAPAAAPAPARPPITATARIVTDPAIGPERQLTAGATAAEPAAEVSAPAAPTPQAPPAPPPQAEAPTVPPVEAPAARAPEEAPPRPTAPAPNSAPASVLKALRRRIAGVIDPTILEERDLARREADTDALTGLANQGAYLRALPAAEADPDVAVIRFDANGFKRVNDELGHAAGDEVLKKMAAAAQRVAGPGARVFRNGGDEFTILAPVERARDIRAAVERAYGSPELAPGVRTSISGGIGQTDAEADREAAKRKAEQKRVQGIPERGAPAAPAPWDAPTPTATAAPVAPETATADEGEYDDETETASGRYVAAQRRKRHPRWPVIQAVDDDRLDMPFDMNQRRDDLARALDELPQTPDAEGLAKEYARRIAALDQRLEALEASRRPLVTPQSIAAEQVSTLRTRLANLKHLLEMDAKARKYGTTPVGAVIYNRQFKTDADLRAAQQKAKELEAEIKRLRAAGAVAADEDDEGEEGEAPSAPAAPAPKQAKASAKLTPSRRPLPDAAAERSRKLAAIPDLWSAPLEQLQSLLPRAVPTGFGKMDDVTLRAFAIYRQRVVSQDFEASARLEEIEALLESASTGRKLGYQGALAMFGTPEEARRWQHMSEEAFGALSDMGITPQAVNDMWKASERAAAGQIALDRLDAEVERRGLDLFGGEGSVRERVPSFAARRMQQRADEQGIDVRAAGMNETPRPLPSDPEINLALMSDAGLEEMSRAWFRDMLRGMSALRPDRTYLTTLEGDRAALDAEIARRAGGVRERARGFGGREQVIGVALRHRDTGKVTAREGFDGGHFGLAVDMVAPVDADQELDVEGIEQMLDADYERGFLTNRRDFVDREEGMNVARAARQVSALSGETELVSEEMQDDEDMRDTARAIGADPDGYYGPDETDDVREQVPAFGDAPTTRAPMWYSALERAVRGAKMATQPGAQWWAWLRSNASKLGVKKTEIDAVGVEEYLTAKAKERITRDEFLAFLRENGVQVTEVVFGAGKYRATQSVADIEMQREIADINLGRYLQSRNLPQREPAQILADETLFLSVEDVEYLQDYLWQDARRQTQINEGGATGSAPAKATRFDSWQEPGGREYTELALTLPVQRAMPTTQRLTARGHEMGDGADDNRVAHVRFNWRTTVDGKRVLFIEEIQSDWAQQGEKLGFRKPESAAEIAALEEAKNTLRTASEALFRAREARIDAMDRETVGAVFQEYSKGPGLTGDQMRARAALRGNFINWQAEGGDQSVRPSWMPESVFEALQVENAAEVAHRQADAALRALPNPQRQVARGPFVTDTQAWVGLVVKRMIRYAAEHGAEQVAWTPGVMQVKRYSTALRKKVNRIAWTKTVKEGADGRGEPVVQIVGFKDDVKVVDTTERETALSDAIGKAMAERIIKDSAQTGEITGKAIAIDSTGMAAFYDGIVPSVVNAIVKKLGGTPVESIALGKTDAPKLDKSDLAATGLRYMRGDISEEELRDDLAMPELSLEDIEWLENAASRDPYGRDDDRRAAREWAVRIAAIYGAQKKMTVPGFTITPTMRQVALTQGFAIMEPRRSFGDDTLSLFTDNTQTDAFGRAPSVADSEVGKRTTGAEPSRALVPMPKAMPSFNAEEQAILDDAGAEDADDGEVPDENWTAEDDQRARQRRWDSVAAWVFSKPYAEARDILDGRIASFLESARQIAQNKPRASWRDDMRRKIDDARVSRMMRDELDRTNGQKVSTKISADEMAARRDELGFDARVTPGQDDAAQGDMFGGVRETAYHGTPHIFDRFATEKIGTGEGSQAYGWGLYFAQNEGVARGYRAKLSGDPYPTDAQLEAYFTPGRIVDGYGGPDRVLAFSPATAERGWFVEVQRVRKNAAGEYEPVYGERPRTHFTAPSRQQIESILGPQPKPGALYRVDIRDDAVATFLDWDKPLSEQAPRTRVAIKNAFDDIVNRTTDYRKASELSRLHEDALQPLEMGTTTGSTIYRLLTQSIAASYEPRSASWTSVSNDTEDRAWSAQEAASKALLAAGIRGIKFLDAVSRNPAHDYDELVQRYGGGDATKAKESVVEKLVKAEQEYGPGSAVASGWRRALQSLSAGPATRNLVVFDENDVTITHRNGEPVTRAEREQALDDANPGRIAERISRMSRDPQQMGLELPDGMIDSADATLTFGSVKKRQEAVDLTKRLAGSQATVVPAASVPTARAREKAIKAHDADLAARIVAQGSAYVEIKGQSVGGPNGTLILPKVHQLLLPFRSPRVEMLGALFLNDAGEVLGATLETSGALTGVALGDVPTFMRRLEARARQLGATRLVQWHNHPSGNPKPSIDDEAVTRELASYFDSRAWDAEQQPGSPPAIRYEGHYVINHETGNFLSVGQRERVEGRAVGQITLTTVPVQSPRTSARVDWTDVQTPFRVLGPSDLHQVIRASDPITSTTIVYMTAQRNVVAVEAYNPEQLATIARWLPKRVDALAAYSAVIMPPTAGGVEDANLARRLDRTVLPKYVEDIVFVAHSADGTPRVHGSAAVSGVFNSRTYVRHKEPLNIQGDRPARRLFGESVEPYSGQSGDAGLRDVSDADAAAAGGDPVPGGLDRGVRPRAGVGRTARVAPEDGPRLAVLHNLTADNLAFADKTGGLSVPSLGIVPAGGSYSEMGEITLLGKPHLGDPTIEPIHDADVYSPTFPRAEYKKPKSGDLARALATFAEAAKQHDEEGQLVGLKQEMERRPDPGDAVSRLIRFNSVAATFLATQGVTVRPVTRPAQVQVPWVQTEAWKNYRAAGGPIMPDYDDTESRRRLAQAGFAAIDEWAASLPEDARFIADHSRDQWATEDGLAPFNTWSLQNSERAVGRRDVDFVATRARLERALKGKELEFKTWVERQIVPMFGEPFLTVNRKRVPFTLNNIVDVMSGPIRGQQDTMVFGAGNARAKMATRFNSLQWMRNAAGNIKSGAALADARKVTQDLLKEYQSAVVPYHLSGNTWEALSDAMRALVGVRRSGMVGALRGAGFRGVPANVIALAQRAYNAFVDAPVPYFEAKPQRAVALDEFAGAVIPRTASSQTKAILLKHGIDFRTYNPTKTEGPSSRAEAVAKLQRELGKAGRGVVFEDVPTFGGAKTITVDGVARPTENSNGQPIHPTEEGLRNFWRWFGDSKVVDAEGRPLVAYHGTDKKFTRVNPKKGAMGTFWFTTDRGAVERGEVGAAGRGVVMELYVKMDSPANWKQYDNLMLAQFAGAGLDGALLPSRGGFDGFVFRGEQIKSAVGNAGTFDGSPNILREPAAPFGAGGGGGTTPPPPPSASTPPDPDERRGPDDLDLAASDIDYSGKAQRASKRLRKTPLSTVAQQIADRLSNDLGPIERLGRLADTRPHQNPDDLLVRARSSDETFHRAVHSAVIDPITRQDVGPPFHDLFAPFKGDAAKIKRALTYVYAKRVVFRGIQAVAGNSAKFDRLTNAARIGDRDPALRAFADRWTKHIDAIGNYAVRSGLWTPELWARIKASDIIYVRIKRVLRAVQSEQERHETERAKEAAGGVPPAQSIEIKPGVDRFTGSDMMLENPAIALLEYDRQIIHRSDIYRVVSAVFDAVDALGPKAQGIAQRVAVAPDNTPTEQLDLEGMDEAGVAVADLFDPKVETRLSPQLDPRARVIRRNGPNGQEILQIDTPELWEALVRLTAPTPYETSMLLRATLGSLRAIKRVFTATTTGLAPAFTFAVNPQRDVVTAQTQSQAGMTLGDTARGVRVAAETLWANLADSTLGQLGTPGAQAAKRIAPPSAAADEASRAGITGVALVDQDTPAFNAATAAPTHGALKHLNQLRRLLTAPLVALEHVGRASDLFNRVAEYEAAKRKYRAKVTSGQWTEEELRLRAARLGRAITQDFSTQPGDKLLRGAATVTPFLSASLRGPVLKAQAAGRNPKRFGAIYGAMAFAAVAAWVLRHTMLDDDDREEFNDRPATERAGFVYLPVGRAENGQVIFAKIALGQEDGVLFAAITASLNAFYEEDPAAGALLVASLERAMPAGLNELLHATVPLPGIQQIMENRANRKVYGGRPVEPRGMQDDDPKDRRYESTPITYDLLASAARGLGATEMSPLKAENVARGVLSKAAPFITTAGDAIARPLLGREAAAPIDRPLRQSPVNPMSALVAMDPPARTEAEERFYDLLANVKRLDEQYRKAVEKKDLVLARSLATERSALVPAKFPDLLKNTEGRIKESRAQADAVRRRFQQGRLTEEEARVKLDAIRRDTQTMIRRAMQRIETP